MIGSVFGRLTVLSQNDGGKFLCRCTCGGMKAVRADHLRTGLTTSCGCLRRELTAARGRASATHGMHKTPEYKSWQAMRTRCLNPKSTQFGAYGGRGITICDAWHDFAAFYADMGPRPAGTTLDRIDTDGGYEPGNCRWATMVQQENNKRSNVMVTLDGRTQTVAEWARALGVSYHTIRMRLRSGWSEREALTLAVCRKPRATRALLPEPPKQ